MLTSHDAELCGREGRSERLPRNARHGGDGYDQAAAARTHGRKYGTGDVDWAEQIGLDLRAEGHDWS